MAVPQTALQLNVLIVGAGIGGMAAALSLGRRGHNVTILEVAPKLLEVGAGIQVAPNMLRLLDRWGVGSVVREKGVALDDIHILRWEQGQLLGKVPINRDYGDQFVIHRADLHNALIDKALALPNVNIRLDARVTDVEFDQASVVLASGEVVSGDVVLAADGIKSLIRGKLLLDAEDVAIPTGDAVFRIILSKDVLVKDPDLKPFILEKKATRWVGPDRHIIAYPVRNHELYNVVLAHPDRGGVDESWTTVGSKKAMIAEYQGWDERLRKIIDLVPDGEVLEWKLCSHQPLKTWVRGSVALMGDACHPMLPYVAQGAAQAVEDAAALGVILSKVTKKADIPLALRAYERARKTRAETVQQSGGQTRKALHFHDGPEQIARDKQFQALTDGGENPDKWGDPETQRFLWLWDSEENAGKEWDQMLAERRRERVRMML